MKYLDKYHILYTSKKGEFRELYKYFKSIEKAENWLKSIGAKYWEIGFLDLKDNNIKI